MKIKPNYDLMEEMCEACSHEDQFQRALPRLSLLEMASLVACTTAGYEASYHNRPFVEFVGYVRQQVRYYLAEAYIEKIEHDYLGESRED